MPTVSIESNANKQLRTNYARTLKQIKHDYKELMERFSSLDQSVSASEAFMIELGKKVVNRLILTEDDAKKLGRDTHTLPSFIKRSELWALCKGSQSLLLKLCERDAWLRRLTGADSKHGRVEDREAFHNRVNKFKKILQELMKDTNEYELCLPFIEKFEQGTLGAFNDYRKQLGFAERVTPRLLKGFCEQDHKGSLQVQQASVLNQVFKKLSAISDNRITREELKFKQTKAYKEAASPMEKRILLKKHMDAFRESLPLQEKLEFLDRVLQSQQPFKKRTVTKEEKKTLTKEEKAAIALEEKERMLQYKADKKEFAPLFKRNTKAEQQGNAIPIIQHLKDLRAAFAVAEEARIGYLQAVQASQLEARKRKTDSANPSAPEERPGSHKKQKTESANYARKMRLFHEAEQQSEQTTGQTVDMDLETADAPLIVPMYSK